MKPHLNNVRELTKGGRPAEAVALAEGLLARRGCGEEERAELLYLKGMAHMKTSDWKQALDSFMQSEQLVADGPAGEARRMLLDILEFYNKDMFNQ